MDKLKIANCAKLQIGLKQWVGCYD